MLSLRYLKTQSDKTFSKAELNKNVGWNRGIKCSASTVIGIISKSPINFYLLALVRQN